MKIYIVVRVTRKYLTVYNHDINIRIIHIPVEEDDHEVINDDTSQDMRVTYTHHASIKDPHTHLHSYPLSLGRCFNLKLSRRVAIGYTHTNIHVPIHSVF